MAAASRPSSSPPRDLRLYSAGRDGVVKLWDGSTTRARPSELDRSSTALSSCRASTISPPLRVVSA